MLLMALSGIGVYGAIYHLVGIPWLIRSARANIGKILAVNSNFGSLENAGATVITGLLIDQFLMPDGFHRTGHHLCGHRIGHVVARRDRADSRRRSRPGQQC